MKASSLLMAGLMAGVSAGNAASAGAGDVSINEIVAKNETSLRTESGFAGLDWVELHNAGDADVDVTGWYFGNDPAKSVSKWKRIQGSCIVPAHGYRIVWCDGDGLCGSWAAGEAHVDCNISTEAGKHTLFIANAADPGSIIQQVPMSCGFEDVSYGRGQDSDEFFYFPTPTPGSANVTAAKKGVTPAVTFSERHGYKTAPFQLSLSCADASAPIYYTLNGASPVPGAVGTYLYSAPIAVSKTTVVRAAVCDAESILQLDTSATYLFLADIFQQNAEPPEGFPVSEEVNGQVMRYGMRPDIVNGDAETRARLCAGFTNGIRTVSFVIDPLHLFDKKTGIYVNATSSGDDWERPMMVEQIYPSDPEDEFSVPCGVRIRGAFSRRPEYPKHGFHLIFRSGYGMSKLNHPLFGSEGADSFDRIDFRCEQNCSWANGYDDNTLIHEVFSRDSQRDMGQTYNRSRYYHLFLNGVYWGVYQTEERFNAAYLQSYLGGSESNYDVVRTYNDYGRIYHTGVVEGDPAAWSNLWHITMNEGYGAGHEANFNRVLGLDPDGTRNPAYPIYVNVTNLVCYLLTSQFTVDGDTPASTGSANNINAFRNRVEGDCAVEGFCWNRHDSEHALGHGTQSGSYYDAKIITYGSKSRGFSTLDKFNPAALHGELCGDPGYRRIFADIVQQQILTPGGAMTAPACEARYRERMAEIHGGVMGELARWGGSHTIADWDRSNYDSIQFIRNRGPYLIKSYRDLGWFPQVDTPEVLDRAGVALTGSPSVGSDGRVYLTGGDSGTVYYTTDGSDPCLANGEVSSKAITYTGGAPAPVYTEVIGKGDVWKYSEDGAKPAEDWMACSYDDSGWKSGPSALGFGSKKTFPTTLKRYVNGVSGTQISTYYFRRTFTLPAGAEKLTALRAQLECNDGYIAYLNGVEIMREMVSSDEYEGYSETYDGVGTKELNWVFAAGLLHEGENTIAVEVHQFSNSASAPGGNTNSAWWNLGLAYADPGPAEGGIAVPASGLKLAVRVKPAAGDWSALNRVSLVGESPCYTGVYDEPVVIDASDTYVFSNATLNAGLRIASGVTAKILSVTNTVNAISSVSASEAGVIFSGDGTVTLEGGDTLATVLNLIVESGTFAVRSTGVAKTKTPVVNVLGFVEQTGGTIDVDIDVTTTNQIYGIYVANKSGKDAEGEDTIFARFDGGRFHAVVGATKSAALYVNKGSVNTTFKGGEILDVELKGDAPRFLNTAGKVAFKNCQAHVTMPDVTTSGARVFKADKDIVFSDIDGHYFADVRGPDAEVFSAGDRIKIEGGTFELVASDDCFSATTNITVSGGLVYAVSVANDVFDSNGDMEIRGGTVLAYTTADDHEAFDVDPEDADEDGLVHQLRITGGTIFATGGSGSAWPGDMVAPDGFELYAEENADAGLCSGRYMTLDSSVGVKTTAKLPVFPKAKCSVLATCPYMTGDPSFSTAAPSAGSQDFHDLYIEETVQTNQKQLRFLSIYGSTKDGGDTGEYIMLTNISDKVVQLAGLKVNVEKEADWDDSGESASKCLFTLSGGTVPAYGTVRFNQSEYWNGAKRKITNGDIYIALTSSSSEDIQHGKASFDNALYPDVDGLGAALVAIRFDTVMKNSTDYWRSSKELVPPTSGASLLLY